MIIKHRNYFSIALGLMLITAVAIKYIPMLTAGLVIIFAASLWFYDFFLKQNNRIGFYVSWLCAIILGILVGLYRPHDFNYPLVFSVERLHAGGLPSSLYVNTAKFFAGLIILYFFLAQRSVASAYIQSRFAQFIVAVVLAVLVIALAYQIVDLQIHVKLFKYIVLFGLVNVLVTCLAEEAFMRLLLQEQIQKFIAGSIKQRFWQELIPLAITTFIFVLTHSVNGLNNIVVFAVAGFCYGLVYSLTKNIWACVVVHFAVNIIHFSFFTYPLA